MRNANSEARITGSRDSKLFPLLGLPFVFGILSLIATFWGLTADAMGRSLHFHGCMPGRARFVFPPERGSCLNRRQCREGCHHSTATPPILRRAKRTTP